MAAGDVTIHQHTGRTIRGMRIVTGTVQYDGSNPTPVALAGYLSEVQGAVASLRMATPAIPTDAMMGVTVSVSGTTINLYAWQNTSGTDPTPAASTDNTNFADFVAWGKA